MNVRELEDVTVKYYILDTAKLDHNIIEEDAIEHYRELGYTVYKNYAFYFRKKSHKKPISKKVLERNSTDEEKIELMEIQPKFPKEVYNLFKQYTSGEPDLLLEKDGEWEFIEVKTTNDSIRPNQILFLEQLGKLYKTSIHYFIEANRADTSKVTMTSKEIKEFKSLNNFKKQMVKIKLLTQRKGYKPFWGVAQALKRNPTLLNSSLYTQALSNILEVNEASAIAFLKKNKRNILMDEYKVLVRRKNWSAHDKLVIDEIKKELQLIK